MNPAFTLNQTVYLTKQGFNLKYSYVLATTTYIGLSFNAPTSNIPQEINCTIGGTANLDLSSNTIEGGIPYALGLNLTCSTGNFGTISQNNLTNRSDSIKSGFDINFAFLQCFFQQSSRTDSCRSSIHNLHQQIIPTRKSWSLWRCHRPTLQFSSR